MHGQLDLWVKWVLPQEEDRLYYTMALREGQNSFRSLKRLGGVRWVSKSTPHSCESPRYSPGKNSHCSQRP